MTKLVSFLPLVIAAVFLETEANTYKQNSRDIIGNLDDFLSSIYSGYRTNYPFSGQEQESLVQEEITPPHSSERIRLRGENGFYGAGIVEVYRAGRWGLVCDDHWDLKDATVACRQLGFKQGAKGAPTDAYYGIPAGRWSDDDIVMDDITCDGDESSLQQCNYKTSHDCKVPEAASVVCSAYDICPDGWTSGLGTCYQFFGGAASINTAEAKCNSLNASLVSVDSPEENHFLSNIITLSSAVKTNHLWYTSGQNIKGQWSWQKNVFTTSAAQTLANRGKNNKLNNSPWLRTKQSVRSQIDAMRWFPGWNPSRYAKEPSLSKGHTCLVLSDMYDLPNGTMASVDYYYFKTAPCNQGKQKINFICELTPEKPINDTECYTGNGSDYRGTISHTEISTPCIPWTLMTVKDQSKGIDDHNYCRNPDNDKKPWCWVSLGKFGYCPVPQCSQVTAVTTTTPAPDTLNCPEDEFFCLMEKTCVPEIYHCDGESDCAAAEDEKDCVYPSSMFVEYPHKMPQGVVTNITYNSVPLETCASFCVKSPFFVCISFLFNPNNRLCQILDLAGGLQVTLVYSASSTYYVMSTQYDNCTGRFRCNNNRCISQQLVCNDHDDCGDMSEESNCGTERPPAVRVRLSGGDEHSGRVEVFYMNEWGVVCDDSWDIRDARVVCRMLGYPGAVRATTGSEFGQGQGDTLLDEVECTGNETSLQDCPASPWKQHDCFSFENAGVECSINKSCKITQHKCSRTELCVEAGEVCDGTFECPDGSDEKNCELRVELVNGTGRYEGRVELVRNGLRGTVCDDEWGEAEADVICRMLGYRYGGEPLTDTDFGSGIGIIWMDNVNCLGNETSLTFCSHSGWTINDCSHLEDAGVRCHVTRPTTMILPTTTTSFTAERACEITQHRCSDTELCVDAVNVCDGTPECPDGSDDRNCELRVELVNGTGRYEGRVELVRNGLRGTVCDDEWGEAEADVICRMLGYRYGGEPLTDTDFGSGIGIIWMDNVNCLGNESSLAFCSHSGWTVNDCSHPEDAGVRCHVTRPTTMILPTTTISFTAERACEITQHRCSDTELCVDAVNVCDGTPECPDGSDERNCELRVELVNGTGRYEGRVELVRNGLRGTVCDDEWGKAEADVICRMLGYRYGGEPLTQASFGSGVGIIWMDNVNCLGNESSLAFCSHSGWTVNDCNHLEDAGVRCHVTRPTTTTQSTTTSFTAERACEITQHKCSDIELCVDAVEVCDGTSECPDGSDERSCELRVELVNGTGRYEGRVELVRNGLRGTVCDDEWGKAEADVICRMLGYRYGGEPLTKASFGNGTGIIWMDNVDCLGNESSVVFCSHSEWTVNDCSHLEDAGVRCHVTRPTATSFTAERACKITQHKCSNMELCVDTIKVCDGTSECPDGLDEWNCELRVELVNGMGRHEGRVELVRNGLRGTVCDDEWGKAEADVVCRMLGYRYGGEPLTQASFGSGTGIIWMDNVNCLGNESSLAFCSHSGWTVNDCSHLEDAGVRCHVTRPTTTTQSTTTAPFTVERACEIYQFRCFGTDLCVDAVEICDGTPECPDGSDERNCELRVELVNGTGRYEGRVELVRNGLRGTVCDDEWGKAEADVICRMLGYRYGGEPLTQASFGSGTGIIWMDNVNCLGNESSLAFCSHSGWTVNDCSHLEDAGVRCHVTRPTTTTLPTTTTSFTTERDCEIIQHRCFGTKLCVDAFEVCDGTPKCPDGSDERNCELRVELVNGTGRYEGRVELVRNGLRGTVCDDEWGKAEADVICRMLGYRYGGEPLKEAGFGKGIGIIWMDNVNCLGNESSLAFCSHSGWTVNDCNHLEDAGVRCHVTRPTTTTLPTTTTSCTTERVRVYLVAGATPNEGRVELAFGSFRGTICDDSWDDADATVICRMAGYTNGGKAVLNAQYGAGSASLDILLDEVNCDGTESCITQCQHQGLLNHNCDHSEDAGVVCHVTGSEDNEQTGVGQQTVSSRSTTISITPTSIFDEPCGLRPLYRSRRQAFTPLLNDSGLRELQPSRTQKIVGGLMALHGEYPWQVGVAKIFSILVNGNVMVRHSCGATIISKHWVLSAAHCFENIPKSRVILRVGDYGHKTNDEGEQTFEVEELIMHENYDTDTHDYDIALLKVKSEDNQGIKLNDYAQPACLPAPGIVYTPSMPSCFISGWGETGYGSPSFLRGARVPILGWNFCNRLYKNALTSRMICAGNIQGGTDTCQGDSGGPLVCEINGVYTLMGVTSWGFGCAKPNSPGVYTNVVEFLTWIEDTVRRNS